MRSACRLRLVGDGNGHAYYAELIQPPKTQVRWPKQVAHKSVAAEVANRYFSLNHCTAQLTLTRPEADSRPQPARLRQRSAAAGLLAPAQTNSRVTQQAALCQQDTKALVALTALAKPDLKQKLALAKVPSSLTAAI